MVVSISTNPEHVGVKARPKRRSDRAIVRPYQAGSVGSTEILDRDLESPEKQQWIRVDSKEYINDLDLVVSHMLLRQNLGLQITYLLDFDVIFRYLQIGSTTAAAAYEVDVFLQESKENFAIPIGAFLELLDWLNQVRIHHDGSRYGNEIPPTQVARVLMRHLSSRRADLVSDDYVSPQAEDLEHYVDRATVAVDRLISLLRSPRFVGVVADYDPKDKDMFFRVLQTMGRPALDSEVRARVDDRDAQNLAVVAKRLRSNKEGLGRSAFLLLSQTNAVLGIPKAGDRRRSHDSVFDAMRTSLGAPGASLRHNFPIALPRTVLQSYALGLLDAPERAQALAKRLRGLFRTVHDLVEDLLRLPPGDVGRAGCVARLRAEMRTLVSESGTPVEALFRIESMRATKLSLPTASPRGASVIRPQVRGRRASDFLGLLQCLYEEVAKLDLLKFKLLSWEWRSESVRARRIVQGTWPALNNDVYIETYGTPQAAKYYFARWPTATRLATFARCLYRSFDLEGATFEGSGDWNLTRVSVGSADIETGLLIYTSTGNVYSAPLWVLAGRHSRQRLILLLRDLGLRQARSFARTGADTTGKSDFSDKLAAAVQSSALPFPLKYQGGGERVLQYRINTSIGDVCLDEYVLDGQDLRYVSFLSHLNWSPFLAKLVSATGLFVGNEHELSSLLEEALAEFPRGDGS